MPDTHIDNYRSTLPMGKGLSSSAAVCVLVVQCLSHSYGLGLSRDQQMQVACKGEQYTPSSCGMMDFCVAMGGGRVAVMTMSEVMEVTVTQTQREVTVKASTMEEEEHKEYKEEQKEDEKEKEKEKEGKSASESKKSKQHCSLSLLHNPQPLYFAVADLRAGKDTIRILSDLNACFPVSVDVSCYFSVSTSLSCH